MVIKIAVTSAGSAPAVAVIKALKKQRHLKVHITGLDMDPASSGRYLADDWAVIPPSGKRGFISHLLRLCKKLQIRCLIPIIDEELFIFAANREIFQKAGIKLIVSDKETIRLAKNKYLTYEFCVAENIPVPKTFTAKELGRIIKSDYPLIMKPLDGRGSRDVIRINDREELEFFKAKSKNFLVQEFIEGNEYTIDIVASPDGKILQAIPRQRLVVKAGMSYKGRTVKDSRLMDYGKWVAGRFKINGPANIQCIANRKDIYLIEVNPKFAAGLPLTVAAGVNIPLILIKLALGMKVGRKELEFSDKIYMLRFWEEIFVSEKELSG